MTADKTTESVSIQIIYPPAPSDGNAPVQQDYSNETFGTLTSASGNAAIDREDLLAITVINWPSPSNPGREKPDPDPLNPWTDADWNNYFNDGEDKVSIPEETGYLDWNPNEDQCTWKYDDLIGSLGAACGAAPGDTADNIICVGVLERDQSGGTYEGKWHTEKKSYKGEAVAPVQPPILAANEPQRLAIRHAPWMTVGPVEVNQFSAPGLLLTDTAANQIRASLIEVAASNVEWSYLRPRPVTMHRPSGLGGAAGRQWGAPSLPPGCIYIWQNDSMRPKVAVVAESERQYPGAHPYDLTVTRDQIAVDPRRPIFLMVNFPDWCKKSQFRDGTFDLHIRVLEA